MLSPFPGMDPYLEAPDIWPDFHDALAGAIREGLNRTLPRPYYARTVMRPEIGIVAERPRTGVSPSVRMRVSNEPLRHHYVEIRDASHGHALVTLIEIASPSNKRPGPT